MLHIGVDLGTSAVKILLVDDDGRVRNTISREYPLYFPQTGWSEQNPADWWEAVKEGIKELLKGYDGSEVASIGCGGQMHGLVILDDKDAVIRNAILWNDGRSNRETAYLNNEIGKEKLSSYTANIAFAGFTAPKILWVKNNEPENFARISKIMLPKDYINYCLSGVFCTDYSDASGMLLLDVEHRCWSKEMLEICGVTEAQLPKLFESYEAVGTVRKEIAEELGINPHTVIAAGAGDNAAAAVGTGTVKDGSCNISLGTSGTIFISTDRFGVDAYNGLHSFAHANGKYHLMGCMLSAASCNKWFLEEILKTSDYSGEQADIHDDDLGTNEVFFLPYLMGERSPINDTDARGMFIGLSMNTTRAEMIQAVYEGVSFAIRDSFEIAGKLGIPVKESRVCGGGAKSMLWCKILSNILNIPLEKLENEEGPGYGGAMLGMVASGRYPNVQACAEELIKGKETITPSKEIAERYEEKYRKFSKIYPSIKQLFKELR